MYHLTVKHSTHGLSSQALEAEKLHLIRRPSIMRPEAQAGRKIACSEHMQSWELYKLHQQGKFCFVLSSPIFCLFLSFLFYARDKILGHPLIGQGEERGREKRRTWGDKKGTKKWLRYVTSSDNPRNHGIMTPFIRLKMQPHRPMKCFRELRHLPPSLRTWAASEKVRL